MREHNAFLEPRAPAEDHFKYQSGNFDEKNKENTRDLMMDRNNIT